MKINFLFLFFFITFLSIAFLPFQKSDKETTFESIYKKVSFYSKKKENKKALLYSKKLLQKGFYNNNIWQQAKAYSKIGEFQRKLNYKDSAFYSYNKSKNLFLLDNDSIQVGRNLLNIAIIESNFGSFSTSDSTLVESIKFINGKRNKTTASAYNCLAINSTKQFLYKDAILYFKKALNFSSSKSSDIKYKNNLASVYKDLKEYSKSILILEDLLEDEISSKKTKARILDNLAYTKWLQNPKKNVLKELLNAKNSKEKIKDNYGLIASYSHLSDYFKEKDKKKSLFYANKMYAVAKKEKATNGLLEAIDKIVHLHKSEKSIFYLKESIHLRDSLQKENTQRHYKFAKIKYNYEEEEKQKLKFEKLATENKLIAEQENNQKKNIFIFLILVTFGFVFYINRRKQQHKKKILQENYNTEIRIAKKLHDELGNGIYNIIAKVQSANFKTDEIVNDLDKVYLQTRKISHENDAIETGHKFENYFKELIASYNSDACKIILKDISVLELNALKEETQIVLYRVFNELFVNMKKHSKATLVVLSCKKIKTFYEIIYTDNGIGFKNNAVILKNGLTNMENRIKTIGGNLNFENQPAKGCRITIRFKK